MNSLAKTLACGSGLLALVIAASMSGCSSSDSNGASGGTGGTPSGGSAGSSAGSSAAGTKNGAAGESEGGTGGSLGAAGADTTGAAGADTSAAGDTGAAGAGAEGSAVAKFCNQVTFGTVADPMDTTFRLEIGTAPNIVSISATTGTCVPMTGACKSIPLGPTVPYKLIDTADGSVVDLGTIEVADGKEYLFLIGVDDTVNPAALFLDGGSLTAAAPMCSAIQYSDL